MTPTKLASFEGEMQKAISENAFNTLEIGISIKKSVLSSTELNALEITQREQLVGNWWREGAQGFLFGPRGLGKTWLALHLARCLAEGRNCGPWAIPKSRRVLYIDGEMPLDGIRDRNLSISNTADAPLFILSHQRLFDVTNGCLNLCRVEIQRAITEVCLEKKIEVLFLDNLSCLFAGMKENDADDWELALHWLLDLRRKRIAVCTVAHAGRDGSNMRGTSRREDAASWVMRIEKPNDAEDTSGACFVGRFTKNREGNEAEVGPWQWSFTTPADGKTHVVHKHMEALEVFLEHVRSGLDSCSDIADEMRVSKGTVCKWAKKAVAAGKLWNKNGRYVCAGS